MEQGFYKIENGVLLYAPNAVLNKNYTLLKEEHDTYTYPVDGWSWFNSLQEAKDALRYIEPVE